MPEFAGLESSSRLPWWPYLIIALSCCVLIWLLKTPGIFLSIILFIAIYYMIDHRPNSAEIDSLRSSVILSVEDIEDIEAQYNRFAHGSDTSSIADRTLKRPELLNTFSTVPEIESFHYLLSNSDRFIQRVRLHLNTSLNTSQLEKLLDITDQRASQLQQAWIDARRAARRYTEN